MREYLGVAKDAGISTRKLDAVVSIVMAVSAGRVRAQLQEARAEERGSEPEAPEP